MKKYTFDVTLSVTITVEESNITYARRVIADMLEDQTANLGHLRDGRGRPILSELKLSGDPDDIELIAINGDRL